ncbi:MAG: 50S ribosomal protein L3 [Thermoanaerobaculia bacterium]|nr:50S ribosomal protein L3 [Thermoanaerobaculia bacterium]
MITGILGRKIGMTQLFAADGTVMPVTVVEAGPCLVVQRKTKQNDGYDAVQLGLVGPRPSPRRLTKADRGHFEKAGVPPTRTVGEVRCEEGDAFAPGDKVLCDIFNASEHVDIVGVSKGKGFQGFIKRHGFAGGVATHGSMFHRLPGSIGSSAYPSRVYPGTRSSGRMGGKQVTTKNLEVVKVDAENHLIYLRGAVPGARNAVIKIVKKAPRTRAA